MSDKNITTCPCCNRQGKKIKQAKFSYSCYNLDCRVMEYFSEHVDGEADGK